ncbi:hypothetical protein DFA_10627 [Cavenderia fasciculata]|uniref:Complex 1 LYR protein domain-containing protein n=1 Tax=Cavenderia fasciculata TaxID=261658 RepID=F4QAT1_CACFS|nr:uncharacterized protein DFA_10627 [Cavenderia fasciculata]EGG15784.1 hypothetical protein DFA_10627 [Cavenderia fasciculata]|eukprot:XP_004354531.1 hypothetical protein DFA_10627 [Cavenderia fasciculata]
MKTSIGLYRDIVRAINRKLPPQSQTYYWTFTREHFEGHRNDTDPQDVEFLINKGYTSLQWIIKKISDKIHFIKYASSTETGSPRASSRSTQLEPLFSTSYTKTNRNNNNNKNVYNNNNNNNNNNYATSEMKYTNKRSTTATNSKFRKETLFIQDNTTTTTQENEPFGITSSTMSPIAPKGMLKFTDQSKQTKAKLESDHKIEQELINDSKSFFANQSNHAKYIKWLGNRQRYRVPTDWYKSSFWRSIENKREYIKWMANIVGKNQSIDEWHYLTDLDFKRNFGSFFIDTYGDIPTALADIYPEHSWKPWLFERFHPSYFYDSIENQRAFVDWLAQTLNITSPEQWYQVTTKDIKTNRGFHLLKLYNNSPYQLFTTIFGKTNGEVLQSWRFKVIPKKKLNILILKDFLNHLFNQINQNKVEKVQQNNKQNLDDYNELFNDILQKVSNQELETIIEMNHGNDIINEFGGSLQAAIEHLEIQEEQDDSIEEETSIPSSFEDAYEIFDINDQIQKEEEGVEEDLFDWDHLSLLDRQEHQKGTSTKYTKNVTNKKKKK